MFLRAMYELYQGRDGKYSNIQRAIVLSALTGSVTREQILLTGMYGGYRRRHIRNADRLLSNNSELPVVKGQKYTKEFRRLIPDARQNNSGLTLYTTTTVGLHRLANAYMAFCEREEPEIFDFFNRYYSALQSRPSHDLHTDFSHDIAVAAFSLCTDIPCYYKEMYVCNPLLSASVKDSFYLSHTYDVSIRSDAFLTLCGDWKKERMMSCVFYEQDTGSQREDIICKKADAYEQVFQALFETNTAILKGDASLIGNALPALYEKNRDSSRAQTDIRHPGLGVLLFGIACVYDACDTHGQQDKAVSEKNSANGSTVSNELDFSAFRVQQAAKKLLATLSYVEDLLGSITLSELDRMLQDAVTHKECYLEDYTLFQQLRQAFPKSDSVTGLMEGLASVSSTGSTVLFDAYCHLGAFLKRRNFIFQAFDTLSFATAAERGFRVLAAPNQLLDVYFPFLFPDECGLYEECRKAMLYMGYSFKKYFTCGPLTICNITFPCTSTFCMYYGESLAVIYENLSLDVTAKMRIQSFFLHNDFPENTLLLCFFLADELEEIRRFASNIEHFPYYHLKSDRRFTVCFCCMEEMHGQINPGTAVGKHMEKAPSLSPCIFQFLPDKTAVYHVKPSPSDPAFCRMEIVPVDSTTVLGSHIVIDKDMRLLTK